MEFSYIIGTILLTVYGQIILKWRIAIFDQFPATFPDRLLYFGKFLLDPFVISSFLSAFIASLCWIAALTKFDLSYAYPFMSATFVIVLFLSCLLFQEPFTLSKILGIIFIIIGITIGAQQ